MQIYQLTLSLCASFAEAQFRYNTIGTRIDLVVNKVFAMHSKNAFVATIFDVKSHFLAIHRIFYYLQSVQLSF